MNVTNTLAVKSRAFKIRLQSIKLIMEIMTIKLLWKAKSRC